MTLGNKKKGVYNLFEHWQSSTLVSVTQAQPRDFIGLSDGSFIWFHNFCPISFHHVYTRIFLDRLEFS